MNNLKAKKEKLLLVASLTSLEQTDLYQLFFMEEKDPNLKISIEKKNIQSVIKSENFLSKVLEIEIEGKKEKVLPREVSYNVVSDEPIHIDFLRIVSGSTIVIEVPVQFKNHDDSPGLKRGGVLNIVRRKVEFKCSTDNIPNNIEIDLSGTDIGTSIKISSVKLPTNVIPTISDRDFVIATVAAPTIIKEPEKPAEGEAVEGAEGEAAPAEGAEAAAKEGETKKDEKGKDPAGDKKAGDSKSGDKKTSPEKKPPEKK